MTLRERLLLVLTDTVGAQFHDRNGDPLLWNVSEPADAILAAIREHVTTEEALDSAAAAYWSDGDLVADIGDVLKKAILAALGGEP